MKKTSQLTAKVAGAAKMLTEKTLVRSANSTSCLIVHEPKAPKSLSKFKKL